jgi:putative tryptophan/tyrosine transport system substrate-binding protein
VRRRDFITLLVGAGVAWPLAVRAQQTAAMRRVVVFMSTGEDDPQDATRLAPFERGLQELGWAIGRNLSIDYHWAAGDPDSLRKYATEMRVLAPDAIVASGVQAVTAAQQTTDVPIVFINIIDPVSAGFVSSLAQPGGNTTGFLMFEYATSAKWVELLKQIAPEVMRAAVLRDVGAASGSGQLGAIQSAASQLGLEFRPVGVRDASEIEHGITDFARGSNGGLIVTGSAQARVHLKLIIGLAARHRLPAVYFGRVAVDAGGLISYGPSTIDSFRFAAGYIDRILKGEKPADLPVQAPTKYELVINLKTAKALGLEIPPTVLATADEVIE